MKTTLLKTLTLLLLATNTVSAQNYEPLELAKKVFNLTGFPEINRYITGEYNGEPNGENLPLNSTSKFILLEQKENTAVVNMTVLDSAGKGLDTYLHFVKDTVWKITAFRALAMMNITEQYLQSLENMTLQQVDEVIEKSKSAKDKDRGFIKSREDYEFQLGNARLTLELDDNLIKHFLKNQTEFERIKDSVLKSIETTGMDRDRKEPVKNLEADYRKLFIMSVTTGYTDVGNHINFLIGGILDNTVGYIFVKDKKDLPSMSPDRVIMLREVRNGWYLYKTT